MKTFCYHVAYTFQDGDRYGFGDASVTWDGPVTTYSAVSELRHMLEEKAGVSQDRMVILNIIPLPDEDSR